MEWSEGMRVEACRSENEYRRAWFEGVVVTVNEEGRLCKILYDKIVTRAAQPLVEDVCPSHLRPIPPHMTFPLNCSAGNAVEAYENNCWCRSVIIRRVPCGEELWAVYLLDSCIIKACGRSNLRPALQWQGGTWTVIPQERDPAIEQVFRFLSMDKAPNEAQVTAVSRRSRGRTRIQNVSSELTAPAGNDSRISSRGRKKQRLGASIVPRGIQKDTGNNAIFFCAGEKLKQTANLVLPHTQEDVGNNSTFSGEGERVITDIVPLRVQEPLETHETWNDVMALEYHKENDIGPLSSPERDSSKRVDEERNCKESLMGNAIQNPETDGEARRLNSSESKGRELILMSRETREECSERSNSKIDDCGVAMENNDREGNISEGHECELLVYQKMSWAFHSDNGTISRDRLNLLDALRLRLKITPDEHKMAMEEALAYDPFSS